MLPIQRRDRRNGQVEPGAVPSPPPKGPEFKDAVASASDAAQPRTRYLINAMAKTLVGTGALLPDRLADKVFSREYGLPR